MAGYNKKGPNEEGPMTGRKKGYCSGNVSKDTDKEELLKQEGREDGQKKEYGRCRGCPRGKGQSRGIGQGAGFGRKRLKNLRLNMCLKLPASRPTIS